MSIADSSTCIVCTSVLAECGAGLHCNEIQEGLCDAVNNLVKHFYKPEKEASDYLLFLCNFFNDFYSASA